jgi:hypothetical protein
MHRPYTQVEHRSQSRRGDRGQRRRNGRRPFRLATSALEGLERAIGIEPTTYSLGSCRSTTELRPQLSEIVDVFWLGLLGSPISVKASL